MMLNIIVSLVPAFILASNNNIGTLAFSAGRGLLLYRYSASQTNDSTSSIRRRRRQASAVRIATYAKRVRRVDEEEATTLPTRSQSERPRSSTSAPTKRAPHQFDHRQEQARPFIDALTEIQRHQPNEDAKPYDLAKDGAVIEHAHFETRSLSDLFPNVPNFSRCFATSAEFRTAMRSAMRADIFDTTPAYHSLSEKARRILLLPDSSLQGSWKCQDGAWARSSVTGETTSSRMTRLSQILQEHLGSGAPTGDVFMDTIGALCGTQPSTHWIDIVGVQNRRVPHSWHQDTGRSDGNAKTVLLGLSPVDNYDGVGVFSHVIRLKHEQWAPADHPPREPVLYGALPEMGKEYIVRPRFAEGRELIVYRDVDVLHSSPDVAYRASVMRFM